MTPWGDGPNSSGKDAQFGTGPGYVATAAYMNSLVVALKAGSSFSLHGCRTQIIQDLKDPASANLGNWAHRVTTRHSTAAGVSIPVGMEIDYDTRRSVSAYVLVRPFGGSSDYSFALKTRNERWNAAAVASGIASLGARSVWSALYADSNGNYRFRADQTNIGVLDYPSSPTDKLARTTKRFTFSGSGSLVDGSFHSTITSVAVLGVADYSNRDTLARPITHKLQHVNGATSEDIETIQTTYNGEHGYTRTAGAVTLDSRADDVIAVENSIKVRTSSATDAQGVTTISKVNDETGELISETKMGRAAVNGMPAVPNLVTHYSKTVAATANSSQGIAVGDTTQTVTQTAGTATRTLSVTVTDALGRTKRVTDELGRVTSYAYSADGRTTTETLPGGLTRITTTYLDGQLKRISGTAVIPEYHEYTVNDGTDGVHEAGSITETVWTGWDGTGAAPEEVLCRKTTTNFLGWVLIEEDVNTAFGDIATTHDYNSKGQRVGTRTHDGVPISYLYDDWGNLIRQDLGGEASVQSVVSYVKEGNQVLEKTVQTRTEHGVPHETVIKRRLSEAVPWQQTTAEGGRTITTTETVDRAAAIREEFVYGGDSPTSATTLLEKRTYRNGLLLSINKAAGTELETRSYNGFEQVISVTTPGVGITNYQYEPATGQLLTESPPGVTATSYAYYPASHVNAGQVKSRTTGAQVARFAYDNQGRTTHQWGAGNQPLRYSYDSLGRMTNLFTYRAGESWDTETLPADFEGLPISNDPRGVAITKWEYHPGTSRLFRKRVSDEDRPDGLIVEAYTYSPQGRLLIQQNGQEQLFYTRDWLGRVTEVSSSSQDTPTVSYTYYPDGSLHTVTDAAGVHSFSTDPATLTTTEVISVTGLLSGITLQRQVQAGSGLPQTIKASYQSGNSAGRTIVLNQYQWSADLQLQRAWQGARTDGAGGPGFFYEWSRDTATGDVQAVSTGSFGASPGIHHLTRRLVHGTGGRIEKLYYNALAPGGSAPGTSRLGYRYYLDALGRRERVESWLPDAPPQAELRPPGWKYSYNERGDIQSAERFKAVDGYPAGVVPHQTRSYAYDLMGNRTNATQGSGAGALVTTYPYVDYTNYYGQVRRTGIEITGSTSADSSVSMDIGGNTTTVAQVMNETGDPHSFRSIHATYEYSGFMIPATITAANTQGGQAEKSGYVFLPPTLDTLDNIRECGRVFQDARWNYFWSADNRLMRMEERLQPAYWNRPLYSPRAPLRKMTFAYDYLGRRIAKTVWVELIPMDNTQTHGWRIEKDLRYLYDGWNMIAELDHTFAPEGQPGFAGLNEVQAQRSVLRTYLWGTDLSGTMTGAGGVGGLLSFTNHRDGQELAQSSTFTYHVCSDANGNVTGLVPANGPDAGKLVARFDYDPFGQRITNTGPDVELCPIGFSSKYTDSETGLVYYGYRYYNPELGRWLSRDPIGERGGVNLYGMVGNNAVNKWDYLGLYTNAESAWCRKYKGCCLMSAGGEDIISDKLAKLFGKYSSFGISRMGTEASVVNAVQHCAWMCFVANRPCCDKQKALELGEAHEQKPNNDGKDKQMDLFNNNVGANISVPYTIWTLQDPTLAQVDKCILKCIEKARAKQLIWLRTTYDLTGNKHTGDLPSGVNPAIPSQ